MKIIVLALACVLTSFGQPLKVDIPYQKFVLNNGLTLIVHEDHKAPIVAVNVWYHVAADRLQHDLFNIEVHEPIAQRYSKEYIEAVVADAMKVLPSPDTLVVVNPRRIAVILDHQARRVAVIPVDLIEQVIDGQMKRNLLAWLASPATSFYVMYIAGSWFGGRGTE